MSDVTVTAKKDFQFGRGVGAPMVSAGQSFPCLRSVAAELAANGLVEVAGGEDLGAPVRAIGSALPRGAIQPPVYPVAHGDVSALGDEPPPAGQMAPTPFGESRAIEGTEPPKPETPAPAPETPAQAPAAPEATEDAAAASPARKRS